MASVSLKRHRPCQNDIDDLATPNVVFSGNNTFPRFLVIQSQNGSKSVTSLSPFVIEKQIESLIGTPKSVKKLKNKTLLVETFGSKVTNRKFSQSNVILQYESLGFCNKYFALDFRQSKCTKITENILSCRSGCRVCTESSALFQLPEVRTSRKQLS